MFALIGLYLLLFKRSEKLSIYENTIVLTLKGQELLIPKEQISQIEYQKLLSSTHIKRSKKSVN
ncbi:hypothetical protein [Heyndrickxia sporothermodurans]|uniref:hypothetical protein n=1 Tax=Heyndrickxia sporothermodurans TaxID=46224 RepID=UPI0035DB6B58